MIDFQNTAKLNLYFLMDQRKFKVKAEFFDSLPSIDSLPSLHQALPHLSSSPPLPHWSVLQISSYLWLRGRPAVEDLGITVDPQLNMNQ